MTKPEEKKKTKGKERRKKRAAAAQQLGREILGKAIKGGYEPAAVPKNFVGKGDYRTRTMRGRGDYTIPGVIGDGIGKAVNWLSSKATSFLGGLFGSGDYASHPDNPEQNSLWGGASVPTQVHSTKDRAFVFRGREQITNIYSNSAEEGAQVSFDINPGLERFMEWLSIVAPGFSEWYPNGLVFEYVSAVSPQAPNSSGKVAMTISYDNGDPDPSSFRAMSQYQMAVQAPPYQSMLMAGECKPHLTALNWFKVRTGDVAITDDAHSVYDWGKLHIRSGGQATTGTLIGTVFVAYEIVFQKQLAPRPVGRTLTDVFNLTTTSSAAYFGTARTARSGNTLGLTFSSNNTFVFPSWVNSGKFLINVEHLGTAAVVAGMTFSATGATLLPWQPSASTTWAVPGAGVNTTVWSGDVVLEVTAPSATFTITGGTVPTAGAGVLIVTAIDTDVTVLNRRRNHYEQYWKAKEEEKLQELKYVDDAVEMQVSALIDRIAKLEAKEGGGDLQPPPSSRALAPSYRLALDEPFSGTPHTLREHLESARQNDELTYQRVHGMPMMSPPPLVRAQNPGPT
jgi:hypothetical protein